MTKCSCGFEGSYDAVCEHLMANANHRIIEDSLEGKTYEIQEFEVCEKCGTIIGIKTHNE